MSISRIKAFKPWCRFAPAAAAALTTLFLAIASGADVQQYAQANGDGLPAWIPAVTIGADLSWGGHVRGELVNTLRSPSSGSNSLEGGGPCPGVCSDEGGATVMGPAVNFGLQITGPRLGSGFAKRMRPFAHAGYHYVATPRTDVYTDGAIADSFRLPNISGLNPASIEAQDFLGQGSQIEYKINNSWSAGLGVAYRARLESLDRNLWIKASIDYYGEQATVRAEVAHVLGTETMVTPGAPITYRAPFNFVRLAGRKRENIHGVGPHFTLETGLYRRGPIAVSLFAESMFYWLLSGRSIDVRQDEAAFTGSDPEVMMSVTTKRDRYTVRGGVGIRVSWLGD